MQTTDDMTLVQEFAAHQSETAFATLVTRHLDLVHSAAIRQVGDPHLAEEITQAVFLILARKARSLRPETFLIGWLFQTTRYAARTELRARARRQRHETAAFMDNQLSQTPETAVAWPHLAPLLDEALAGLNETDRRVLLLRFFERRSLAETGAALALSDEAARKRATRALDKLRRFFARRGVTLAAAVIAGAVAANSVQAAPAGFVAKVSASAAKGAATTHSMTALVKGTLKTMAWGNLKMAVVLGSVMLFAGVVALPVLKASREIVVLQISGTITQNLYRDEKVVQTWSNSFVVSIGENHVLIEAGAGDDPKITGFEYGTLGQDSYLLARNVANSVITEAYQVNNGVARLVKLKTPTKPNNDAELTINNRWLPEYSFGLISPVWMAYCFQLVATNANGTETKLPPIFSMGAPFRTNDELADITYALNDNPPHMVKTLTESGDSTQFKSLGLSTDEIFTNALYRVLTWTNVGGFTVAKQFQVTNYQTVKRAGITVRTTTVYDGIATNVVLRLKTLPAFKIPDRTWVVDRRSAVVSPLPQFAYLTTSGVILTRKELLKNKDYSIEISGDK